MTERGLTTIDFHGATLIAQRGVTPEKTLVAMKPMVEGMGLDWGGQHKKLREHPVLAQGISVMEMPSEGGVQQTVALPLNRLHFWLATLHPNRIEDAAVRERVVLYQTEAADVLFAHFFGKAIATGDGLGRSDVGGIVKSVVNKRIEPLETAVLDLAVRVRDLIAGVDGRVAVGEYISVKELLDEAKALPKGRNGLNRRVGAALRALVAMSEASARHCPRTGTWLFPVDLARKYMRSSGSILVAEHNARVRGQGVLPFRKPGKGA